MSRLWKSTELPVKFKYKEFRERKDMEYCGNFGAHMDEGRFCPKCSSPKSGTQSTFVASSMENKNTRKKKSVFVGVAFVILVLFVIIKMPHMVDKPCNWCDHRPSMEYKISDGSKAYIYKNCSKNCALCYKKAKKYYENMLGIVVFVCDDCYKQVTNK